MKQAWTRLARMIKGEWRFREQMFNSIFLKHHKNASEIILNKKGEPLAAVYFTPTGMHQEETKHLMRTIRDRVCYRCDEGEDEDA